MSFAALPDERDLQVLEDYYIHSIMLTTVLDGMQIETEKNTTQAKSFMVTIVITELKVSAFMKNWLIN